MSAAKKRKKEEDANERPLRSYRIPKTYKLPSILEVMESGNVNLYCEVNSIRISKDLLVKSAIIMVTCNYKSDNVSPGKSIQTNLITHGNNTEAYFIAVEKSDFLNSLKDINGTDVCFIMLNIFEDYLILRSYNKEWKEVATSRVTAMMSTEEPILHDPGEIIDYKGKLKIVGKFFLDKIPAAGKELKLDFETETYRLRLTTSATTKNLETSKYIDMVPPKKDETQETKDDEDEEEYQDEFGENSTKLLKKIIDLFKENYMLLKFALGCPIHIAGTFDQLESIKFYMAGKIREEDEDDS